MKDGQFVENFIVNEKEKKHDIKPDFSMISEKEKKSTLKNTFL